jgi:HEAT repeat protein
MVSDAHSTVAQHGCKSVGLLSKGLRTDFEKHGIELIPAIMVKFKEKRQMFVDECKQCLELLKFSVRLDQIAEHLGDALKNANPLVRKHTVLTIESFSLETYKDHMQDATPTLMEKLVKCIDDKDGAVRESTLHVIGIMKAKLGEQYMEKYLEKIPDAKKPKIQEGFDKV